MINVHYYYFNIADYRKDTTYLTFLEHGIYRHLLDQYYLNESCLTLDLNKLMRESGVRTNDEKEAFMNILNDFFTKTDDGYRHYKCDKELEKVYEKSVKARKSAEARWQNKQNNANASKSNANASKTQCERNANGMLPNTHNPIPNTHNKKSKAFSKPSVSEIQDYISEKKYIIDAEVFFNYYESNGWKVGKNPMKNWKATVANWNSKEVKNETSRQANKQTQFDATQYIIDAIDEDIEAGVWEDAGNIR